MEMNKSEGAEVPAMTAGEERDAALVAAAEARAIVAAAQRVGFENDLTVAKQSGQPFRTEHHLEEGDKVIYLNSEELAEQERMRADWDAQVAAAEAARQAALVEQARELVANPEALAELRRALLG